jgi:hypothetical protein
LPVGHVAILFGKSAEWHFSLILISFFYWPKKPH